MSANPLQQTIEALAKEKGIDISALQAKLDEINSLRSALVDAMNEGISACAGKVWVSAQNQKLSHIRP